MRTTHQGMYNVAAEDGRREVMAGLQQQQQQNDAVGQMVAGARNQAGQEGFVAGEQSGANKAMNAILANQAGLGNEQGQPAPQPQQEASAYPPEAIAQATEQLTSRPVSMEELTQIDKQNPGLLQAVDAANPGIIEAILAQGQTQAPPVSASAAGLQA